MVNTPVSLYVMIVIKGPPDFIRGNNTLVRSKPSTHVARNLLGMDLGLDVQMACNDLQQKL